MDNPSPRSRSASPPGKMTDYSRQQTTIGLETRLLDLEEIKRQNPFEYYIKKVFLTYDDDKSNALDHQELRKFLDELRCCLNLLPADDSIFYRILEHLDDNKNG